MLTPILTSVWVLAAADFCQEEPGREQKSLPGESKHKENPDTASKGTIYHVTGKTDG